VSFKVPKKSVAGCNAAGPSLADCIETQLISLGGVDAFKADFLGADCDCIAINDASAPADSVSPAGSRPPYEGEYRNSNGCNGRFSGSFSHSAPQALLTNTTFAEMWR
jgi:hypothetical protein